jgi:adenylate cyclase class 2
MAREVEVKFRLADPAALRRRLRALGSERVNVVHETNLILDSPERELLGRGCGLRIRAARPLDGPGPRRVTLTYKGPRDPAWHARGIRAREEIEIEIADQERMTALLARVGFAPVLHYEKRRETWPLGDAEVVVDELPRLGWFAEIEASDGEVLESLRVQLQLPAASAVSETYPQLAARYGTPEADGSCSLRFPADAREAPGSGTP